jgi:hypothetical protein
MILFGFAIGLTLVHLFAGRLRFLEGLPRSRWLSFAGGVSVSYVFLRLLPELGAGQERLRDELQGLLGVLEHHLYIFALLGLVLFYAIERMIRCAPDRGADKPHGSKKNAALFWLHMASFAAYNFLIGYLLIHEEATGLRARAMFTIAMAVHFLVSDAALREIHKQDYHDKGRWILSAAVLLGWGVGVLTEVPAVVETGLTAFLAGGIILNVLKEELPAERESRLLPFLLGTGLYGVLLLAG